MGACKCSGEVQRVRRTFTFRESSGAISPAVEWECGVCGRSWVSFRPPFGGSWASVQYVTPDLDRASGPCVSGGGR
jgi:hypothetical protein